ncbi:MAG: NADH-quinone oxidoreductase subunit L, partial [Proteobacteria bacterium]|nr:NADH-quinone oxidoreductase subunit L [Pseudomonadota bacterium]
MTAPSLHDPTFVVAAVTTHLPFAAFVLIALVTRRRPRLSAGLSLAAAAGTLAGALLLLFGQGESAAPVEYGLRWFATEGLTVDFGFLLDPLSRHMLAVVAGISFLVQVYSVGFMRGDPGYARYFGFLSLFVWAMALLTLSSSLLQLYVFWELVGLASYLLIGFWYEKWSATAAGKKAFLMTRVGDVAFLLGIVLLLQGSGTLGILEFGSPGLAASLPPGRITAAVLLLFVGIIGKSAQFPLLTWLPDAMEGPTPVSALLHSATMVAAGVYLFARLFPLFTLSPTAMTVCLAVGTVSMLLSSTMALVSRDIKAIWAYSTISQLGYMIMALAAGSLFAGIFHLTTHAAFKALLFLCSGVLIQRLDTHDIYEMSERGGRRLTVTMVCLGVAGAALAGLPPFSGFFSKERILAALAGLDNPLWLAAGLVGVFLTA